MQLLRKSAMNHFLPIREILKIGFIHLSEGWHIPHFFDYNFLSEVRLNLSAEEAAKDIRSDALRYWAVAAMHD